jgi:transcriptional regulator with XRE-family HTH domain
MIERATAVDDGCIAVGGLASKVGQLRPERVGTAEAIAELVTPAGVTAIARLIQLARREARMTLDQFGQRVGLEAVELESAEAGVTIPEPRVLHALSEGLKISYQKLLMLAGHQTQRDEVLERDVLKFAASSGSMDKLTKGEERALHDLLQILHD